MTRAPFRSSVVAAVTLLAIAGAACSSSSPRSSATTVQRRPRPCRRRRSQCRRPRPSTPPTRTSGATRSSSPSARSSCSRSGCRSTACCSSPRCRRSAPVRSSHRTSTRSTASRPSTCGASRTCSRSPRSTTATTRSSSSPRTPIRSPTSGRARRRRARGHVGHHASRLARNPARGCHAPVGTDAPGRAARTLPRPYARRRRAHPHAGRSDPHAAVVRGHRNGRRARAARDRARPRDRRSRSPRPASSFFDELGDALAINPPVDAQERATMQSFADLGIGPGRHPSTEAGAAVRSALARGVPLGEKILDRAGSAEPEGRRRLERRHAHRRLRPRHGAARAGRTRWLGRECPAGSGVRARGGRLVRRGVPRDARLRDPLRGRRSAAGQCVLVGDALRGGSLLRRQPDRPLRDR